MTIKLIFVGKTRAKHWQLAEEEYLKRIRRHADIQQLTVKDAAREVSRNSELAKKIEGKQLLAKVAGDECVVILDSRGQQFTSEAFADFFQTQTLHGQSRFAFIIGGPLGLSLQVLKRADLVLSLSKMTLPHELSKVFLLEQIYRAFSILRNEKYHK